jgi:hypothetical protein
MNRRALFAVVAAIGVSCGPVESSSLSGVSGFVKFPGETPPPAMHVNGSDEGCPPGIAQDHLIVKQITRGLGNALVVVERQDRRVMPSRMQTQVAMKGCRIEPRIAWVPLGTSLVFLNKDKTVHQLRALQNNTALFRVELSPNSGVVRRAAIVPGFYELICDRHPWEHGWIFASKHDSAAVTDDSGRFSIKNLPTGRYSAWTWHEGWEVRGRDREGRLQYEPMGQTLQFQKTPNFISKICAQ